MENFPTGRAMESCNNIYMSFVLARDKMIAYDTRCLYFAIIKYLATQHNWLNRLPAFRVAFRPNQRLVLYVRNLSQN